MAIQNSKFIIRDSKLIVTIQPGSFAIKTPGHEVTQRMQ